MIETDKELREIYSRYLKICTDTNEAPLFTLKDLKRLRDKKRDKSKKNPG